MAREAGFIAHGEELAPTIALADLEIIFDVLRSPAERLHYLTRRAEFERRADYVGDELDLLAFYLDRGFSIGEMEFDGTQLQLWGMSRALDPYFMQQWGGPKSKRAVKKPARRLTPWWRAMLERLDRKQSPGWLTMSMRLLDVAYEDQEKFERGFRAGARRLKNEWMQHPNGLTTVLTFGGSERRSAIIGLTFRRIQPPRHRELLHGASQRVASEIDADRVVGIGLDIARNDHPCGIIACPNLDGLGSPVLADDEPG